MFRDTMALKMNPFGPSFPATAETREQLAFLTDLDRRPLRLDQCDALLRPLFCSDILGLDNHKEQFCDLMSERGYELGESGSRSSESALVVIRGALGAGKTTLGAWMIAELAKLPGDPWRLFHVPEPKEDTDTARIAALDDLQRQIEEVPKGTHVAVLVENLTEVSLDAAVARFELLVHWPRVFVLTTHNIKLLDADERLLGGSARIEVFTLRQIKPADADAYVAHRLPQYREPQRPEIEALSPVFPFPPGLAGRYVQQGEDRGAAPVVLRQLNTHFRGRLAEHARYLRGSGWSVETATPEELERHLLPEI